MDERQPGRLDQLGVKYNRELSVRPQRQLGAMSYRMNRWTVHAALTTQFSQERANYEKGGHGGDPD
jgi:hypothetical protein